MGKVEFVTKLYTAFDFLYRLFLLNLLWLAFTILGIFLFGFGPSTVALFDTIRKQLISGIGNDKDLIIFFFSSYKKHFIKGNIIGWSIALYFYMLLVNYRFTNFRMEPILQFINGATIVIAIVSIIVVSYFLSLFVHYELTILKYIRTAIILTVIQPLPTILIVFWIVLISYLTYVFFPYSLLLFLSALVYGIMGLCYSSFVRNEQMINKDK
ncbi:YesL family protein [Alkalibacterium iburiense]|uniref:YesL family protein n=1 Tax=Alkalibacterium iburiense TaxID=290589 RepID=A0ABN0XRN9_9LACT